MSEKSCSLNVDTKHESALSVTAHRIESTSEFCPAKHDKQDYYYKNSNNDTNVDIGIHIFSDTVYRTKSRNNNTCIFQRHKRLILNIERSRVYDRCKTSCKEHTCQ